MFGDFEGIPLCAPVCFALFDVEATGEISGVYGDDFVVCGHWVVPLSEPLITLMFVIGFDLVLVLFMRGHTPRTRFACARPFRFSKGAVGVMRKAPSYQRTGLVVVRIGPRGTTFVATALVAVASR